MNMKKAYLKMFVVAGLVLVLAACQSPARTVQEKAVEGVAEKAIERTGGGQADVDIKNENVTVETAEGKMQAGEGVVIPEDFPEDVYVYDGKIISAIKINEKNTFSVSIETGDNPQTVKARYESELKKSSWKIDNSMDLGGSIVINGQKTGRIASIIASLAEDKTTIVVTTGEE